MTRRAPSNYDLVEDLIAHLALGAWLENHIGQWQRGGITGGDGHTQTGYSDPTLAAVERRIDGPSPVDRLVGDALTFLDELREVKRTIAALNAKRHAIEPLREQHLAHRVELQTTTGFCLGCDRDCDASTPYRTLYRELCGSCRRAFERMPSSGDRERDREAFITMRRRDERRVSGRR